MKILVDVNVFEDVFRLRHGWEASLTVLNEVRNTQVTGYVSALTPPILYFFRRSTRGEKAARQAVQKILQGFAVVSLTGDAIERAYATVLPDFEDALQLEAAKAANVEAVVTRNKKHFRQKDVRILTPEEFVQQQGVAPKSD
jgi:predicted nucleic acid-binding protein